MTTQAAEERPDTERETRETVRHLAAESFTGHVLTRETDSVWRCAKPGSGFYAFRVLFAPGTVVVVGDVGNGIFRASVRTPEEAVSWLRDAHWDYLAGKLLHATHYQHFYADQALDYARERLRERETDESEGSRAVRTRRWRELVAEMEQYRRGGDLNEYGWMHFMTEYPDELNDCYTVPFGHGAEVFWLVEALAVFVRLYDAQQGATGATTVA